MGMLIATATLARQDLINSLYRALAAGLRGGDRLLVLAGGGQPVALAGPTVEIARTEPNPSVPASWDYFLRRAFVEGDYGALMILGDGVRLGPAQVASAKALLARHLDVDLLLSYWGFDVQVHRRGNERTIGFYDTRYDATSCADDDYARTMTERRRTYQRFHELDPLPGSVRGGTSPGGAEQGRRAFAAKWPGEPHFSVNQPSAAYYHTNRYVAATRPDAAPAGVAYDGAGSGSRAQAACDTGGRAKPGTLAVVTVAAYPRDEAARLSRHLAASARKQQIHLRVFGVGEDYPSHAEVKIRRLRGWIGSLEDRFTHVLFVDCRDAIFQGGTDQICAAFNSAAAPILVGAEEHCYPAPEGEWPHSFPRELGARRFLNSGVWMADRASADSALMTIATIQGILRRTEPLERLPSVAPFLKFKGHPWLERDDQFLWQVAWLSRAIDAKLDHQCALVYNRLPKHLLAAPSWDEEHRDERLHVPSSQSCPPILHFPGQEPRKGKDKWANLLGIL